MKKKIFSIVAVVLFVGASLSAKNYTVINESNSVEIDCDQLAHDIDDAAEEAGATKQEAYELSEAIYQLCLLLP